MSKPTPNGPELVIIAAVAEKNRVIGKGYDLPWHIPEDLKHFKRLTSGHPLLMGRRSFEAIIHQWGRPLPDRRHLVLTSRGAFAEFPDVETYPSVEEALRAVEDEPIVFIGGGTAVYAHFLPIADRLELTLVEGDYEGDVYFPPFEHLVNGVYTVAEEERHEGFRFVTYVRSETQDERGKA